MVLPPNKPVFSAFVRSYRWGNREKLVLTEQRLTSSNFIWEEADPYRGPLNPSLEQEHTTCFLFWDKG